MVLDTQRVVIKLQYREIVPVDVAGSIRIDCLRGRVWITEDRSMRDIVLETGESYEVARRGIAVVQALRETTIALRASAAHAASTEPALMRPLWRRWAARPSGRRSILVPSSG